MNIYQQVPDTHQHDTKTAIEILTYFWYYVINMIESNIGVRSQPKKVHQLVPDTREEIIYISGWRVYGIS